MDDVIILGIGRQILELTTQREQLLQQINMLNKQLTDAKTTIEALKKPTDA